MRIDYYEETYRELEDKLVFLGYESTSRLVDSLMWCYHEPESGMFDVADFCKHERAVSDRLFNVFIMLKFSIGNIKEVYTFVGMDKRTQRKSYSVNDLMLTINSRSCRRLQKLE